MHVVRNSHDLNIRMCTVRVVAGEWNTHFKVQRETSWTCWVRGEREHLSLVLNVGGQCKRFIHLRMCICDSCICIVIVCIYSLSSRENIIILFLILYIERERDSMRDGPQQWRLETGGDRIIKKSQLKTGLSKGVVLFPLLTVFFCPPPPSLKSL